MFSPPLCRTVIAALPGGDTLLRSQQARLETRLQELKDDQQIRQDLKRTRIGSEADLFTEMKVEQEDDRQLRMEGLVLDQGDKELILESTSGTEIGGYRLVGKTRRAKELLLERIQVRDFS